MQLVSREVTKYVNKNTDTSTYSKAPTHQV